MKTIQELEVKRLRVPFEIKGDSLDDDLHTFEGMASTWDLDLGGDVIHRGAFKKTLKEANDSGRVIPLLDSHHYMSVRSVLGKMLDAKETAQGLWAKFAVIDGPDGEEVWRRLKAGLVSALSIGYRPIKTEEPTESERLQGVWRHLKEVALKEISLVLWPMNPGAQIDLESAKTMILEFQAKDALNEEETTQLQDLMFAISELVEADTKGAISYRSAHAKVAKADATAKWDASKERAAYPNKRAVLRRVHAWVDADGDPDAKGSYKFPHHEAGDGNPVNRIACSAGIAVLNGARGGAAIPSADRRGIYNHLRKHLVDDFEIDPKEVPELKAEDALDLAPEDPARLELESRIREAQLRLVNRTLLR